MEHPEFASGHTFTDFISKNMSDWKERKEKKKYLEPALIATALNLLQKTGEKVKIEKKQTSFDPWLSIGKWELSA